MRYIVRSVDGAEYGPFSKDELRELVRERRLGEGDFVRREQGRTWSPFEQIAGLAELAEPRDPDTGSPFTGGSAGASAGRRDAEKRETEESTTGDSASAGLRSKAATVSEATPTERPRPEAAPLQLDDPSPSLETATAGTTAGRGSEAPRALPHVDPAQSTNPFVAAGIPIDLEADEEVQFVVMQSFADASRRSLLGALLGHRGRLICTDVRAVAVTPGLGRASITIAWLDRTAGAGLVSQVALFRLVAGVLLLLYAIYATIASLAGTALIATLVGDAGLALAIAGLTIAGMAALIGVHLLLTARSRVVAIGTPGEGIAFPCSAAGPWHLARIDEARRQARSRTTDATAS